MESTPMAQVVDPFTQTETHNAGNQQEVEIARIDPNPYQPRKSMDEDELLSLSDSIKEHGILQPLVVRLSGDRFQLIAGERRLRAAELVGLAQVPVMLVDFNDQQVVEAALAENIQRSDLNPIEKAIGFKDYLERFDMTHDALARRLGLARSTITNLLNLLELATEVQDVLRVGQLTTGHAKVLKGVADKDRQVALCREVISRGLSVHATEALVKQGASEPDPVTEAPVSSPSGSEKEPKTPHVLGIEEELRQKFSTKLEIKLKGKETGQIVIRFQDNDEFERIIDHLRGS